MTPPSHRALWISLGTASACAAIAGPPYLTDDPEPVEPGHWEVYLASQMARDPSGATGTFPHIEVNNGAAPNLQVHLIVPWAFSSPSGRPTRSGMGDTEIGVKYRFIQEGKNRPMVGIFPLLEIPTGQASKGLGAGRYQAFFPVWIQKSWGPWTSYGGGGYWVNPGPGNSDYWFFGWLIQKDLNKHLTLGGELIWVSSTGVGVPNDTSFSVGGQYNFDEGHHLLFSVGRSIGGDVDLTAYVAFQWTFGGKSEGSGPAHGVMPGAPGGK